MFARFQSSYSKEKIDSAKSQLWWDMMQQIQIITPDRKPFKPPENEFRKICYKIVSNKIFEVTVLIVIVINLITMTIEYEGSPRSYLNILDIISLFCTIVFILEAIFKITAYQFEEYFNDLWNRFDFVVALMAIFEIFIIFSPDNQATF